MERVGMVEEEEEVREEEVEEGTEEEEEVLRETVSISGSSSSLGVITVAVSAYPSLLELFERP